MLTCSTPRKRTWDDEHLGLFPILVNPLRYLQLDLRRMLPTWALSFSFSVMLRIKQTPLDMAWPSPQDPVASPLWIWIPYVH